MTLTEYNRTCHSVYSLGWSALRERMLWPALTWLLAVNSPTSPIIVNLSSSVLALSIATFNASTAPGAPGSSISPSGAVFCGGVGGYNVPPASLTLATALAGASEGHDRDG